MEENKLLTEEKYQHTKRKIMIISIIVLIVGLLIGGSLIGVGVMKKNDASKESKEKEVAATLRLSEIKTEVDKLKIAKEEKETICDSLDMSSKTWYEDVGKCRREVSAIGNQINDLEMEKFELETNHFDNISGFSTVAFFMFGGFIIVASCMIAFSIYMFAKRRDILAFSAQQIIPVAQEGLESVAPTIGKVGSSIAKDMAPAYGEIAKEISKGIKEGLDKKE